MARPPVSGMCTLTTQQTIVPCWSSVGPGEADYIPSTVTEHFQPSTQNVCVNFVIVDDNLPPTLAEDDEYFLVSLSTNDNADVIPEQATATVIIQDNDG